MPVAGLAAKPLRARLLGGLLVLAAAGPAGAGMTGAGFFVTADGYFVTSFELVADAEPLRVRDGEGRTHPARIVAADPGSDLALLKVEGTFAAIPVAPSAALAPGDRLFVMRPGEAGAGPLEEAAVRAVSGSGGAPNALHIAISAGQLELGAPLLNAGGDVVGVIAMPPAARKRAQVSGAPAGEQGHAVRSESLLALIEAEQPASAQLLAPGSESGEPRHAVGRVLSGPPDPLDSAPSDQGQLLVAEMARIGKRALLEKDYESAQRWLQEAAVAGDAGAQTALAGMYRGGQGVAQDDAQAAEWYRRAASRGDPAAQAQLGWMHAEGKGVARNEDEAVGWLRQAAEDGNAAGQHFLGVMYRDGRGVYRDDARAAHWFRMAALQGDPAAHNSLGVMFRDGRGVERDEVEAAWWFRRAAEQKDQDAQANLGLMYREGRGVGRDDAEAARWFRRAAEQGHALGAFYLGVSYAEGRGIPRNGMEAAGWLRFATRGGLPQAQEYLRELEK